MSRDVDRLSVFASPDERYQHLLKQRGGLLARGFYQMRHSLGNFFGVSLVSANERSREERIEYHQSLREPGLGIVWENPEEAEANRLIG